MKKKYVIGMDGGGTATNVIIAKDDESIIAKFVIGSLNINGQTLQLTEETLKESLKKVKELGLDTGDCIGVCVGAAGISNSNTKEIITKTLHQNGIKGFIKIVGDHETALAGALEGTCGVILIAGTGSICFGITEGGETYRVGGYGHVIDDEGSAYAIGRDILKAVVRAADGRGAFTTLTEKVCKQLKLRSIKELITWVYQKDRSKKEIAALAVLLEEGILEGDIVSNEILRTSVMELVELAKAILKHFEEEVSLVVSGSVLMKNKQIYQMFSQIIKIHSPQIKIKKASENAAMGAVKIALREANCENE